MTNTNNDEKNGNLMKDDEDPTMREGCSFESDSSLDGEATGPHPTWDELKRIDRHRLNILQKVELPFMRVIRSWRGTCWQGLVGDVLVWLPIILYIFLRVIGYSDVAMPVGLVESLGNTSVDILGGFLSFFLVLFVNQTNTRFFDMYQLSRACSGRVQDIAGYAAARLPPGEAHRLVRYMNAAHLSGYVGLGNSYKRKNFFDHFNNLYGLLQPNELAKFDGMDMDAGSDIFKELCTWCQKEIAKAEKAGHIDTIAANDMHGRVLALRAAMDGIYDTCFQPPHYFYIHFLCVLSLMYLPLFAIEIAFSVGWEDPHWSLEVINAIIVILQTIFVVGLRVLGQKMIDPYGDDLEDISVITIVTTCIDITRIMLSSHDQGPADEHLERYLLRRHNELALKSID